MFLSACSPSADDLDKYAKMTPRLDPRQYFNGKIEASGVFIDRAGIADPYFHLVMEGTWKGNDGKIEEEFVYSDGRRDKRAWNIHFKDDANFVGTAHDVIGEATGRLSGNAMHMTYVLRVPVKDGKTYDLSLSDWMYMLDEETVINRIEMHKFSFKVGELIGTFKKHPIK